MSGYIASIVLIVCHGYIQRNLKLVPKQGSKAPWRLDQNCALDILKMRHSKIDDGVMRFS